MTTKTSNRAPRFRAQIKAVGVVRSRIKLRSKAPKQGAEGAPDVWLEIDPDYLDCIDGLRPGDDLLVITWLHEARRETMKVHPRSDPQRRLTGVFATRSPDRPNPLGLHEVKLRKVAKNRLRVGPMEAIDSTPLVDIKPMLCSVQR